QGDHAESGTGLNIGPNARLALQAHDPALSDAITAAGLPWRQWRISLTDGTVLFDLPLSRVAGNDGWRIRWSELYRVLRDAAAPAVADDCAITSIARNGHAPSIAWERGGARQRIDKVDLLIAADGRYSQVRRALAGDAASRMVGVAISRVLVPDTSA